MKNFKHRKLNRGFSLVEMAVVLIILGFVLGALLLPLQAQRNQLFQSQTENTLETAKKALLGYAQSQGRLPCPATNNGTGVFPDDSGASNPVVGGACVQQVGFLPAVTLGIQPVNAHGFAVDGWNSPIRYAVTQASVNPVTGAATNDYTFTTTNGMSNAGISNLNQISSLRVCRSFSAFSTTCSAPPISSELNYLTNNAVAVIYSVGATGAQGIGGNDENENLNPSLVSPPNQVDTVFVRHDFTAAGAVNGEFDHIVTWISPFVLYNAMIEAGQLH